MFVSFISFLSLIFFMLITFDVSPYLRGPGVWPPEWRWPYLFINSFDRIWLPLVIISIILSIAYYFEKRKVKLNQWILLVSLVLLTYFFQLSILYFSRSGIAVLIHRIINPDLNGYFTEAIKIKNLGGFLADYQKNVLGFSMHATGHPPGGIIFFWFIEKIVNVISSLKTLVINLAPKHPDVQIIWNNLTLSQRSTAVFSAFFIPFLGSLNIIPLFYLAKKLFDEKTALRSVLLAVFIPALTLFTPLPDVFFSLFFLWSFYLLQKGLKNKSKILFFASGLTFSFGLFFSVSLLPLIIVYFYYFWRNNKVFLYFLSGFSLFYLILLLFKYNAVAVLYTLMTGLPKNRSYLSWIFYNLYDFLLFAGMPTAVLYFTMFFKKIREPLFVSFTLMLLLLNFSGAVRGEVGRIWLPLMFPMVLIVGNFLTNKLKLSTKSFLIILLIQAIQIIVIQEFWVTLW